MVDLTGSSDSPSGEATPRRSRDDRSDNAHRQLIGYIGLALPVILVLIAALRPTDPAARWKILWSISAYYHTGAVTAFVGMLVALALFLITYRGYDNKYGPVDRAAARTAGIAALLVALFPAAAPEGYPTLPWWTPIQGVIHYVAAVVLFAMFAVFSLWLFRISMTDHPSIGKRRQNRIFMVCGVLILIGMAWAGIAGWKKHPIFLPESLALAAFAVSWLVKGRAATSIANAVRETLT